MLLPMDTAWCLRALLRPHRRCSLGLLLLSGVT
jgi:hypothetical protein